MEMERPLPFRKNTDSPNICNPKAYVHSIGYTNLYKELIKEANSVLDNFVWNGKDKVKRLALISDIEMGGLKMLDIQSMICAKQVTCLKKLLEDYSSPWKAIVDKLLLPIGGRFALHCNFQTSKLKINLPRIEAFLIICW